MSPIQPIPKPKHRAERKRVDYSGLALAKHPPQADARFREFARGRGCEIRRRRPEKHPRCSPLVGSDYTKRPLIDFMHIPTGRTKGMGQKGSDLYGGFGGCHDLHMEQESIGWTPFAEKYDIDPYEIAKEVGDAYTQRAARREVQR